MIDILNLAVPHFGLIFIGFAAASLPPALNVFVIARQNETRIEPAFGGRADRDICLRDYADQRDVGASDWPLGIS